jgi:glycosyltransferase involved in cell wall biosynthesis
MKSWLEKKIRTLGITGIDLLPPVDHVNLKTFYQESSMVFLPSYYEGLPTIALEAMASRLPVVATDVGGTSEAVSHGKTGFIHSVHDVDGMADSILIIDRNKYLANKLGRAGLRRVHDAYTWKTIGNNFETIISSIL